MRTFFSRRKKVAEYAVEDPDEDISSSSTSQPATVDNQIIASARAHGLCAWPLDDSNAVIQSKSAKFEFPVNLATVCSHSGVLKVLFDAARKGIGVPRIHLERFPDPIAKMLCWMYISTYDDSTWTNDLDTDEEEQRVNAGVDDKAVDEERIGEGPIIIGPTDDNDYIKIKNNILVYDMAIQYRVRQLKHLATHRFKALGNANWNNPEFATLAAMVHEDEGRYASNDLHLALAEILARHLPSLVHVSAWNKVFRESAPLIREVNKSINDHHLVDRCPLCGTHTKHLLHRSFAKSPQSANSNVKPRIVLNYKCVPCHGPHGLK